MSQKSSVDQFTDHRQLVGSDGHIKGHLLEAQVGQVKVIARRSTIRDWTQKDVWRRLGTADPQAKVWSSTETRLANALPALSLRGR